MEIDWDKFDSSPVSALLYRKLALGTLKKERENKRDGRGEDTPPLSAGTRCDRLTPEPGR